MKINWQNVAEQALGTILATVLLGTVSWAVIPDSIPAPIRPLGWVAIVLGVAAIMWFFFRQRLQRLGAITVRVFLIGLDYKFHILTVVLLLTIYAAIGVLYNDWLAVLLTIAFTATLLLTMKVWMLDNPRYRSFDKTQAQIQVWADAPKGIATGIFVFKGDTVEIGAIGRISINASDTHMNPDGIICTDPENDPVEAKVVLTEGSLLPGEQRAGLLVGWIGRYSINRAFKVGSKCRFVANQQGELILAVNDKHDAYADNVDRDGSRMAFTASISVTRKQ